MSKINSDYKEYLKIDGIIDTGIIAVAHFDNPIKADMLKFLKSVFLGDFQILIPLTTFLGAYHILTQYLKIDRYTVKKALCDTLNLDSPLFFHDVNKITVFSAIDYSSINLIESWDAYLIILAKHFRTSNIYTIDEKLKKLRDMNIINPVPKDKMQEYHRFLQKLSQKKK